MSAYTPNELLQTASSFLENIICHQQTSLHQKCFLGLRYSATYVCCIPAIRTNGTPQVSECSNLQQFSPSSHTSAFCFQCVPIYSHPTLVLRIIFIPWIAFCNSSSLFPNRTMSSVKYVNRKSMWSRLTSIVTIYEIQCLTPMMVGKERVNK